ncbi:MAG: tRNA preQ1(34) S-adenosylmethionine ribosyltransferase-isomerase QueA [Pirellula sp.]|jgi:S-adenosylmethionine:tRNA ribosyltransferase-isomerase|nr:tRNA preQ1(34) S-adenosylmethionine ribosyltransferase-isomerase QueA [Pirellula sp.]
MAETPASNSEIDLYDFQLPRELIAQDPPVNRTDSRMMLVDRRSGRIEHYSIRDLPGLLRAGDAVVVNDSKVIAARLIGYRETTKGRWEGLFLRQENGIAELLSSTRGKLLEGERLVIRDPEGRETQRIVFVGRTNDGNFLFRTDGNREWLELLDECGRIPLPPYIRDGQMTAVDRERYQTVYARNPGSVAAPTAGLHLTQDLIGQLRQKGTALVAVTLHVGLGTFRPIQTNDLANHKMHSEQANISEPVVKRLLSARAEGGRIIAVGTTSVRTLETAALHGGGELAPWTGETDIFIKPGHRFRAVDGLLTNFHLPKSSLIVLVSALAGRELILEAYNKAIEERYRFYSYGDCMLII